MKLTRGVFALEERPKPVNSSTVIMSRAAEIPHAAGLVVRQEGDVSMFHDLFINSYGRIQDL